MVVQLAFTAMPIAAIFPEANFLETTWGAPVVVAVDLAVAPARTGGAAHCAPSPSRVLGTGQPSAPLTNALSRTNPHSQVKGSRSAGQSRTSAEFTRSTFCPLRSRAV